MNHNFGEKDKEYYKGEYVEVWQSPKYLETKQKAIELIESDKYKGVLKDSDFWILMNSTKSGKMAYTGLIISHNACLKINDTLSDEKKFKAQYYHLIEDKYSGGLLAEYNDGEMVEYGEVSEKNCRNDYPYAMVLKRCFDRVVLKKSGIAQWGIYSDSEAEEFKEKPDEERETVEYINAEQFKKLKSLYTKEEIQKYYKDNGINKASEITIQMYDELLKKAEEEFKKKFPDKEFY